MLDQQSVPPQAAAKQSAQQKVRSDFHIPSLDGLRALSFLLVFVSHAGLHGIPGGLGVTVFFFLSGYLITTLMRIEHAATGTISIRDFFVRRTLRILPPFYLVIALATLGVFAGLVRGTIETKPMLALVFHLANYWAIAFGTDGQPVGTGVYWSVAVEEHFYLVFPFLFVAMQRIWPGRFRTQVTLLLAICAAVMAWRSYLALVLHVEQIRTFLATDTRIDSILFGCALAIGANPMIDPPRVSTPRFLRTWLPFGVGLLVLSVVLRVDWFRESLRYTVQGLGLAPLFVAAMTAPNWGPFRLLNHPVLKRVGTLSYALYLVHQIVLYALEIPMADAPVLRGICSLALSLVLAEVIQRTVEKPCARLRKKFTQSTWLSAYRPPSRALVAAPAQAASAEAS